MDIAGWVQGRLPDGWYDGPAEVSVDREEIVVTGRLASPEPGESASATRAAEQGRIARFREDTREERIRIAAELEHRLGRKVAWGARCGESDAVFTSLAAPVMTRLRQPERRVLDLLVESGVARSRSDALAWCVRLVGRHEADWISQLHDALAAVRDARAAGPAA